MTRPNLGAKIPRNLLFFGLLLAFAAAGPMQAQKKCYLDPACSAGNQSRARDAISGSCVPILDCVEMWKCPLGPATGTCGGGVQDCTFSPGCFSDAQDCFFGFCRPIGNCNDRIKFQGYSFTPTVNQCTCVGNPPAAGGCFNVRTLTLTVEGPGNVTTDPLRLNCGVKNIDCNAIYPIGQTETLLASPEPGARFAGWSGDADCADGVVTMSADRNCKATFVAEPGAVQPAPGELAGSCGTGPLVVITHGWQPGKVFLGFPPSWVTAMKQAIGERVSDATGQPATVATFTWGPAFTSLDLDGLFEASAATQFEGYMLGLDLNALLTRECGGSPPEIHLIGHSLGTVVNAYAARVLAGRGIHVSQVTLLDPPLVGGLLFPERFFRQVIPRSPAVDWVDNYIATRPVLGLSIGGPILGAALDGGFAEDENHLTIPDFYQRTIEDAGSREGFFYSAALGPAGGFEPAESRPQPSPWDPPAVRPGVLESLSTTLETAATDSWKRLTGLVTLGFVVGVRGATLPALFLHEGSDSAIGRPVTIPAGAQMLELDLDFESPGDGDWLTVSFGGTNLYSFRGDLPAALGQAPVIRAEVPVARFAGQTGRLEVHLHSTGEVNAVYGVAGFRFVALRDDGLPQADAGPDQVLAADGECRAAATLDGSASSDPDGDPLSYLWTLDDGDTVAGAQAQVVLPLGSHAIRLEVADEFGGRDGDDTVVEVRDETPPEIVRLSASPSLLWPPNGKLVPVVVSAEAEDSCDPAPTCRVTSVSSDEPESAPGQAKEPDWKLTGDLTLELRAQRLGAGGDRHYTVTVSCEDGAGNAATGDVVVSVPHDRS